MDDLAIDNETAHAALFYLLHQIENDALKIELSDRFSATAIDNAIEKARLLSMIDSTPFAVLAKRLLGMKAT